MRGKRYETEKKIWGGDRKSTHSAKSTVQIEQLVKPFTSETLGKEYGVSKSTIQRNEQFAKTVDILPQNVRDDVLANKISITQTEARAISMMDKPTQKKFLKEKNGITFLTIWQLKNQPRNRIPQFWGIKKIG